MAIISFGFDVVGVPEGGPASGPAPVINIFRTVSGAGGYNLDGVTQSLGEPPGPPVPEYEILLTLSPTQREPGQGATLRIEIRLNDQPVDEQFTITLLSSDQQVAPVPNSVITDSRGIVLMEVLAFGIGSATISATSVIDGITYASNEVGLIVISGDVSENYDATGCGTIHLSLESTLSRGIYPQPERLSHEEQVRKYNGIDTGLSRVAQFANMELIFFPAFLQQK